MDFPRALRERRTRSQFSQLDLALRAGTTQRHLSFIESGRSVPGRNMVVRLAESLELPLRERNELLLAAGYAPAYPESSLDDPVLAPVRTAIHHILRGHLPYPALVVDRAGDLIAANTAFDLITEGAAAELVGPGTNVYRLALHPDGMAPRIRNLAEWARHILARLGHLDELRAELTRYVPELEPSAGQLGFAVPLRLRSSYGELHLMTTVTTFATAVDVTLAELKLEAFLPADAATAEALLTAAGPMTFTGAVQVPGNT
ncbi:helix-turn-helix domain-containing protein [Streptomyces turgidiscabies]|uniref:Toxin-antitoxin system, antitoxin component, Xre family n=1 Tax=Streptomyces turgidiscabies (strain Car8) TaxID=698760 RepID=L7F4V3_STRT8|nr:MULTISPECIES: helix-turn-helix transcriptional regulator [Streptomyces]ELP66139.1 toxin-antitoxin system, antitoxin component, Xre family [Streptomyces turgidiscabies Car8]MDX3498413.1 helix-turn-helix transcriptional regulator [Streptomyces turgidiscabies]GAQ74560.1 helix-turn-helix protein [Streptomyces turgidiscabies]